jgi:hypothetical protein
MFGVGPGIGSSTRRQPGSAVRARFNVMLSHVTVQRTSQLLQWLSSLRSLRMQIVDLSGKVLLHVLHSSGYVRRNKEMPQAGMVARLNCHLSSPLSSPSPSPLPSHRLRFKQMHHFVSKTLSSGPLRWGRLPLHGTPAPEEH